MITHAEAHAEVDAEWKAIIAEANTIIDPYYALPLLQMWRYEKQRVDLQYARQAQQEARPADE